MMGSVGTRRPTGGAGDQRRSFPLDRAADAHRALEAGKVLGKAVLKIGA
jgi:Zinc-binding dehydrogenase